MSEIRSHNEPKSQDPELLNCQVGIKEFCDEILALRPENYRLTFWDILSEHSATAVYDRLNASSLGDLMLQPGDTLSMPGSGSYHPDLGLYVGDAALERVSVRAWGWEFDKYRRDPDGPDTSPFKVLPYPGEQDWMRRLEITLSYTNGKQLAKQIITAETDSMSAGSLPTVSREVYASAYAEQGYEGHSQVSRKAQNEDEVAYLVALARELSLHAV